jgi:hypothetical protein
LTWSTQNAQSVTLSVDGTPLGTFAPTGQSSGGFSCPPISHTYRLSATGASGQVASRSVSVTAASPPSTTTSSTTTTTT